jgi:TonB family protein
MLNQNQARFGGQFQPPAQRPKGCLGRNWKWMVPAGCLGLILAAVALVGAIFFAAMSALKSSDVYQGALNAARAHPATAERLGEPVEDGWLVKGNVKFDGAGGRADFEIPVSGPKNSGTLYVRAVRPGDAWMFERLDLAVAGAETTSLLDRNVVQPPPVTPEVESDADGEAAGDEGDDSPPPDTAAGPVISGGVLDAKAASKPEPSYPAAAKAARAAGTVVVRVTVDESGDVVSADAVSGHPLLRASAVAAARQAKFRPTRLSGNPVKVSGLLTYNFAPEP